MSLRYGSWSAIVLMFGLSKLKPTTRGKCHLHSSSKHGLLLFRRMTFLTQSKLFFGKIMLLNICYNINKLSDNYYICPLSVQTWKFHINQPIHAHEAHTLLWCIILLTLYWWRHLSDKSSHIGSYLKRTLLHDALSQNYLMFNVIQQ